jgi:hypothetical protein
MVLTGTTHTDAGDYPTDAWSFTTSTNYNADSGTVHDKIAKADQIITWSNPADIIYGTALGATQLNAGVTVPGPEAHGALTYTPASGVILDAGNHQALRVDVAGSSNYNPATATVYINVQKGEQTIVWNNPANIVVGTALGPAQLNAVITGSGPSAIGTVTYNPPFGTILNPGITSLKVDAAATSNYNPATATVYINVVYTFTGFTSPVDMMPVVNKANAGQAIPTKWHLSGANGIVISDPSSFVALRSYPVSCTDFTGNPEDAITEYYAGNSDLIYKGNGDWQFNWKTPKTYAGTCRDMYVEFKGGQHSLVAEFKFK